MGMDKPNRWINWLDTYYDITDFQNIITLEKAHHHVTLIFSLCFDHPPNSRQPIPQTPHCRGQPPIGGEDGGKSASLDDLQPRLGALLEPQPFNGNLPTRIHLFKRPTGPIVCEMVHLGVFERFSSTGVFTRFDDLSSWEASRWRLFGGDGAL